MKHVIWLLCLTPLYGCFQQVAKPSEITLVEAMRQVGEGLSAMRQAQGDVKTGLFAESAEVTFKVAADTKNGGTLKLDLSPPVVSEGVGASAGLSSEKSSSRSNTITVKFKNLLTVPKDTIGYVVAGVQVGVLPEKTGGSAQGGTTGKAGDKPAVVNPVGGSDVAPPVVPAAPTAPPITLIPSNPGESWIHQEMLPDR